MHVIGTIEANGQTGVVFFDDEWDAYGWKTDSFTNGPFDTQEEAEEALRAELS